MAELHSPTRRISFFNAVGVLVGLSSPLVIERHLQTLSLPKRAVWPWSGPWWLYCALAIACAALVGGLTYFSLDHKQPGGRNVWVAPLFVGAPIIGLSLFFPCGRWPHLGMLLWAVAFSVLSHLFVVCRKARQATHVVRSIESLKATISTWQLIAVYGFTAYLAYIISAFYIMWLVSGELVGSKDERLILFTGSICQMAVFSVLIFAGPLREAWQMTFDSVAKLASFDNHNPRTTVNQIEQSQTDVSPRRVGDREASVHESKAQKISEESSSSVEP